MAVELTATHWLDDDWAPFESTRPESYFVGEPAERAASDDWDAYEWVGGEEPDGGPPVLRPEEIRRQLSAVRIEVAGFANTALIASDTTSDFLKTELGMNIIVPSGKIRQLRFQVRLTGDGDGNVVAIDGFPKDSVEARAIVSGSVTLNVDSALRLVASAVGAAVAGPGGAAVGGEAVDVAGQVLEVSIAPWTFNLGDIRDVNVDFSEAQTSFVEWWFRGGTGIKNSLGVVLTLRKPRETKTVTGAVQALWEYEAQLWRRKTASDAKQIQIFPVA
jgi:hypothetical protein